MPGAAKLTTLQKRLGYEFREPASLLEALTHGSYLQDAPEAGRTTSAWNSSVTPCCSSS